MLNRLSRRFDQFHAAVRCLSTADFLVGLGSLCLVLGAFVFWLATPLQGRIKGHAFPLWGGVSLSDGLTNPFRLFSFGTACLLLGSSSLAVLWLRFSRRALFFMGAAGVLLAVYFFGSLVFAHPEILDAAVEQGAEKTGIAGFSQTYLQGNAATTPNDEPLTTNSLLERVNAGLALTGIAQVGIGGYWALLSGFLIQIGAGLNGNRRTMIRDGLLCGVFAFLMIIGLGWRSVAAEYNRLEGDHRLAEGAFEKAVERYDRAAWWASYLKTNPRYLHNRGAAFYLSHRPDRAEAHLYLGDNGMARQEPLEALHEYRTALALDPTLEPARKKAAAALSALGLSKFSSRNPHAAIADWQEALKFSPGKIEPHFYMAHALFTVNHTDQEAAIREYSGLLLSVAEPLIRSDLYSGLGHCYYRQKEFTKAREMYVHSLKSFQLVKKIINFNAYKGLQGV
ncbi:MAG: tetratricopeptide repeat protein [Nitrospirae bacterium]|nr:tetratricopeptide repeat protein [Nitrospirota bacterium]